MSEIFDLQWDQLTRTLLVGMLAYTSLVLLLRWSGNRTLAKMNAFDLVVTISLGSVLATIILNRDVVLSEGIVALMLLIGLQFLVTWSSVRLGWVRRFVTGEPVLLFEKGEFIRSSMIRSRVSEGEILAAIRAAGINCLAKVEAVVLETDGSFSVVRHKEGVERSSLADVCLRN